MKQDKIKFWILTTPLTNKGDEQELRVIPPFKKANQTASNSLILNNALTLTHSLSHTLRLIPSLNFAHLLSKANFFTLPHTLL